ncbi:MAG TPA: 1-acyl-sn-glycerol-3-phosphate acyltransferase [Ktedonobacteraceae bacterium]|nr:1-acyl-sn-glycerol-3-phosphate acyltransferase [Ktedonobacteraceae bacterium]
MKAITLLVTYRLAQAYCIGIILTFAPSREKQKLRGRLNRAGARGTWLVMRAVSRLISRRKIVMCAEGLEYVPSSGPVLIAARHFHFFYDGYVLLRAIRRPLHIIVALDWMHNRLLRLLVEFACALVDWPVVLRSEQFQEHASDKQWAYKSSEARRYLRQVAKASVRILRSEHLLVIFAEGYPNIDPHPTPKADLDAFLPFKPGFIKLAEMAERDGETQVAIVPAGFVYRKVGKRWYTTVRFGPPLFQRDFANNTLLLHSVEKSVHTLSQS